MTIPNFFGKPLVDVEVSIERAFMGGSSPEFAMNYLMAICTYYFLAIELIYLPFTFALKMPCLRIQSIHRSVHVSHGWPILRTAKPCPPVS